MESAHKTHFIKNIIDEDIANHKNNGQVVTRFPPEPNGYLHIGHAKSICLNFGLAEQYASSCYLRFDDTNPCNESVEYMEAIQLDVAWLGFDWGEHLTYASDYFETLHELAVGLIKAGKAYVCSLTPEQVREYRGTLTEPGKNSPDRERPVAESLDLFARMRAGEFAEGQYALRAKIYMSAGNINLRDPMLYRIRKVHHHRTGDQWCIYPMYDFTHPVSDALEGITHSLCTLEFQDHRPLYDWVLDNCEVAHHPQQIEFSRLNLNYTITSKRKLKQLVEAGHVTGWDDPRMSTLSAFRRRGYTPAAIRNFCAQIGISKQDSIIDMSILEQALRDDLNETAPRRMAVLKPLKVVIENYPVDQVETISMANHPQHLEWGRRDVAFSQTLYIEQDDFLLDPPAGYHRLAPGKSVRLLNAYVIECVRVETDADGEISCVYCHYLSETLGGKKPADGRKVKGFLHWLSAAQALPAEVRLYDRLFAIENPGAAEDHAAVLNPDSLDVIEQAYVEPSLGEAIAEERFQFNRLGYFCSDQHDHNAQHLVFNRAVSLKDGWKK